MDLQYIIAVNVISISAVAALITLVWRVPGAASWIAAHGLVIGGTAAAIEWLPGWAGWIGVALIVPLVLAPAILSNLAMKRASANRMAEAAKFARLAAIFHPTGRTRFTADAYAAQAPASLTERSAALQALAARCERPQRLALQAIDLRIRDDWSGVLRLLAESPDVEGDFKSLQIRALGETGRLEEMVAAFEAAKSRMIGYDLHSALLFVMAFAGRPLGVATLLANQMRMLEADARSYWTAVAAQRAGDATVDWRKLLTDLAASTGNETAARAARRHLAEPAGTAAPLSLGSLGRVWALESWIGDQPARTPTSLLAAPFTLAIAGLIIIAYFIEEASGGSQNLRTLVDLGALWPPYVLQRGEWWRLLTAMFLHYGALHLVLNTLLLVLLGRDTEVRYGAPRLLAVYFAGGLVSTGAVLWLMAAGFVRTSVLVGASGAIFAVFGNIVAGQLASWLRTRSLLDARSLLTVVIVLAIQLAVDLSIPEVSLSAHAFGLGAGLLIGLVWSAVAGMAGPGRKGPRQI